MSQKILKINAVNRSLETIVRVKEAIASLIDTDTPINFENVAKVANCDPKTLRRNKITRELITDVAKKLNPFLSTHR